MWWYAMNADLGQSFKKVVAEWLNDLQMRGSECGTQRPSRRSDKDSDEVVMWTYQFFHIKSLKKHIFALVYLVAGTYAANDWWRDRLHV